jgi:hypothetical protein
MPPLVTPSSPEKAIAFWLAGRALVAVGLLVAAGPPPRPWRGRPRLSLALCPCWCAGQRADPVLARGLPRTFLPGEGLTAFKVGFELVLVGLPAGRRAAPAAAGRRGAGVAMTAMAVAAMFSPWPRLVLCQLQQPSDMLNALGHVAKIGPMPT